MWSGSRQRKLPQMGAASAIAKALTFMWCVVWVDSDCFSQCLWPRQGPPSHLEKELARNRKACLWVCSAKSMWIWDRYFFLAYLLEKQRWGTQQRTKPALETPWNRTVISTWQRLTNTSHQFTFFQQILTWHLPGPGLNPLWADQGRSLCLCTEGVCEALIRNAAKKWDVTKEAIPVSVKTYPRSQGTHRRTSDSGSMFCEGHQVWDLLKGQGWEKSWSPRAKSCATEYVPHW